MEKVFASIITIGDELLIGQVIDTNSAWMAQELNKAGIMVRNRVAVGDVWEDIWQALDEESRKSPIILITGGLGPTADDITKPLLCEYFGGKLVMHEETLQHVTYLFEKVFNRPMIERNRKQAEVPDVCTVLKNARGTAPGMLFEKNGTLFISMPGVPHEMKWIMAYHVLPMLAQRFTTGVIRHRTLLTANIGESFLAELIKDLEEALPDYIKLAYLPNFGMVRLRLTAQGTDAATLEAALEHHFRLLVQRTKDYLVVDEDLPMELVVGRLLQARNQTITTAESCTGGYIAHLITSHSGASAYYKGSVVSYDNAIKESLLGVSHETLTTQGAVSEETVVQMASSARSLMQTDYAIAVSGIMGPDGGSAEKPVGMVWVGLAWAEGVRAKKFQFRFDRKRNIEVTATQALNFLRELIVENSSGAIQP
jgi:nicotinamide-nucleotide amidase